MPDATAAVDGEELLKAKRVRRHIVEWAALLVLALVVTLTLRTFVIQTFFIPSGSMEPTLQIGDRIIVDKLAVDWGTIHRGDVLVFTAPPDEDCMGVHDVDLVKRVIGLPGDTLYSLGNTIYVNGQKLTEAWTHTEPLGPPAIASQSHPVVVAARHYYMMGDNHSSSCDSRYWGTITRSDIIGNAVLRVWPFSRIGFL
jgi:signal peptidase I